MIHLMARWCKKLKFKKKKEKLTQKDGKKLIIQKRKNKKTTNKTQHKEKRKTVANRHFENCVQGRAERVGKVRERNSKTKQQGTRQNEKRRVAKRDEYQRLEKTQAHSIIGGCVCILDEVAEWKKKISEQKKKKKTQGQHNKRAK